MLSSPRPSAPAHAHAMAASDAHPGQVPAVVPPGTDVAAPGGTGLLDAENLLPTLVPASWPHMAAYACRPLLSNLARNGLDVPWVAYGLDAPAQFHYLPAEEVRELDLEDLNHQAIFNLSGRELELRIFDGVPGSRLAHCSGDYFASAKILDPMFLDAAHRALKSDLLLAATPRRGVLLLVPVGTNTRDQARAVSAFVAYVRQQYAQAAEDEKLSVSVMVVTGGRVEGVVRVEGD